MSQRIRRWFEDSAETKLKFVAEHADRIQQLADLLAETFRKGDKVLFFGNGGSAMDASHLAAEFVGRYRRERAPLAAMSLSADQAKLSAVSDGTVRLSIGIEDVDDLLDDLTRALEHARAAAPR